LEFHYKTVNYQDETEYSWYGELHGDGETTCEIGSILYVKDGKKTHGQIEVGNDVYEFIDIGEGKHLFYKFTEKAFEGECGVSDHTPVPKTNDDISFRSPCPGQNQISILVLFTPNADNAVPDIDAVAQLGMQQLSSALNNSAVSSADLNARLVDVLPLNFIETGDIRDDIELLSINPAAQTLRQANEADLVVLLTDGPYGSVYGIVADIGPSFNGAYSIVEVDRATSYKTYAHEVGHLFGGRHQNDPNGTIQHGYNFKRWFPGKRRGTILATLGSIKGKPDRRILHYSNPDVEWKNRATGTHHWNDNETHFENNGPTISEFFPNDLPEFSVRIVGNLKACRCNDLITLAANTTCGTDPITYSWEVSQNGISWTPAGNGQTIFHPTYCQYNANSTVTFRVTAQDATGQTVTQSHGVLIIDGASCGDKPPIPLRADEQIEVSVYPNPATAESIIYIDFAKAGDHHIVLLDMLGQAKAAYFSTSQSVFSISLSKLRLQTNIYFLKITSSNGLTKTVPIQIQK